MNTARAHRTGAFTIMELLMVIAIMAIVAGLIVGLAGVSGDSKKIKRTETELAKLVTLIEAYKTKVGVYPPDHPSDPGTNSLVYELAGAIRTNGASANPIYGTPFGSITSNDIWTVYGSTGLINALDEGVTAEETKIHRVLKSLRSDEFAIVSGFRSLVVPVDDPNGQRPNAWRYRVGNQNDPNLHNRESFDLWVEIKVRDGSRIIGNWKN